MGAGGRSGNGPGVGQGIFVIPVARCEIDGVRGAPCRDIFIGSTWRWKGGAARVDGPSRLLRLGGALGADEVQDGARRAVRKLLGDLVPPVSPRPRTDMTAPVAGFTVTDGRARYAIGFAAGGALLTVTGALPPRDRDLTVIDRQGALPASQLPGAVGGAICFTPGTRILTPEGTCPVEEIAPGQTILTRDDGPQEVLWTGQQRLGGARLFAMPHLRPIRLRAGALATGSPDGDLIVSPEHRLLVTGDSARALFGETEVLVEARDLLDDRRVTVEHGLTEVRYIHLLTARHQVIWANGVATETFHPARADLTLIDPAARDALLSAAPGIGADPAAYGADARRCLTRPEAAILTHRP